MSSRLFRSLAATALVVSAVLPAAPAHAAPAPYVRIILDSIVAHSTQEGGGDEIRLKVTGPSIVPLFSRTVLIWPVNEWYPPVGIRTGVCYSPDNVACPPGMPVQTNGGGTPNHPTFPANGRFAHIDLWEIDDIDGDDLILGGSVLLTPREGFSRQTIRMQYGDADYELTFTVAPSETPL
ncbi:hypothetical protein [Herbidospora cretacea]|uniref:hypothetical protein n=1 Tax=Herbidospora cretacea TaxID=28444 RepID=UPI0004C46337|nr:hypothetical protein [Herbidospora cretacea]